jgi:uncharacterized RDD family membrane protein YckC
MGEQAGIVSRGVAAVVDLVISLILLAAIYVGYTAVRFVIHPARFRFPRPAPGLSGTVWIVVTTIYLAGCWVTTGRSLGDQVAGLRVVRGGGQLIGLGRALLRGLLCVLFPIGLLWSVVSRRRASVQDLLVRTSVVYDWLPRSARASVRSDEHPLGMRVDVAAAVADEPHDRHPEPLAGLDREG